MERNELIEQLVTTWEERRRRGEDTSVEELCREHPELVDSVREALASRGEQHGELAETSDLASARAADPDITCDVLGPTRELGKLTRLGPFQIVKLMAEGSMGAVYEAVDHDLGRSVALKVMRSEVAGHEKARARFLREARAAAALEHDHIVRIYEVGEDQGIPYLAMQLLHGQTLNERLQQGPSLSNAEVLRIGREIAEGLAVAHACGLVHRDIKPANVWLEEGSGRVKILDFGLARAANETARLTQDGSLLGTPAYMSPEQADGSCELDHRSDLFSLGSVLYRIVTGRFAFAGENLAELLLALARDTPVPPRQLNPGIPPALDELILGLLAKDPAARPQSAQAVVETIRKVEKASVPGAWDGLDLKLQVKDEDALSPRGRKRLPVAVAALVVITGLAVTSGVLLPQILDAAGNIGELSLDSPESVVAVTVTRGGRTAGVLDPARRPALRLPAGSYGLKLTDGTGTLVLASTQVDLRRGARQVVRLVRNIPLASARNRAAALVAALAIMRRSLMSFSIQPAGKPGPAFRLQPEPIFRFNNPVGATKDGAIFLWFGEYDRPEAAVQVYVKRDGQWVQEFTSLSPGPLIAQPRDGPAWSPAQGGVVLETVPDAPRPADTPEQRLRQMSVLAQEFVAEDLFQDRTWQRLGLLAKPLARYGKPGSSLIDGALFSFVLGTDPEAYLMLEARPGNSGPEWQYAFAPMSTYALRATLKDQEVWSLPYRRGPARGPDQPFHVRSFQPED